MPLLMRRVKLAIRVRRDETGAVLVLFALFMSVAVLLLAFVIDTGTWFAHHRHLQLQADAAAYSAAAKFDYPCTPTVEKEIYQAAGLYGGASTVTAPGGRSETTEPPPAREEAPKWPY